MKALCTICVILPALIAHAQEHVTIIDDDVHRFWKYYDLFRQDTSANPFGRYIAEGTETFRDFAEWNLDSIRLKKVVRQEMAYYDKIRRFAGRISSVQRDSIDQHWRSLKKLYPAAELPNVVMMIGRISSGGSVHKHGISIGSEMYADTNAITTNGWRCLPASQIPVTFLHCVIYHQQKPAHTGYTLLRQSIIEGVDAFVASLISSSFRVQIDTSESYQYARQHEETLVREFWNQRYETNWEDWLYHPPTKDRPRDLGICLGFKIAEAYYNAIPDKRRALDHMFKINDFEKFAEVSGYVRQFLSY